MLQLTTAFGKGREYEGEFNCCWLRIYYVTYNCYDFAKLRDVMFAKIFSITQILLKLSQVNLDVYLQNLVICQQDLNCMCA